MITMIMKAVRTYETSVYFNETTRRYISEDYRLYTHHRQNIKSQQIKY
jgi:hypothetical protein